VHITPDPSCPFCEGHEQMTPHELLAVRHNGSRQNMPGWNMRVVPNQFPVLRVEGTLDRQGDGIFDKMNGIGAHEVIIESPRHLDTLADMSDEAIEQVLWAARERMQDLRKDIRFRYIIVFKNHGSAAGASLDHSCSQLIALPIVPREVRDEVDGARVHFEA
jgi:UDPglucose--hexose-1-phosphate uridylyltransferase